MSLFNLKLPEKEGDYLFLFAASDDCYSVDTLLFDVDGEAYLEHGDVYAVTAWWHLPEPNKLC